MIMTEITYARTTSSCYAFTIISGYIELHNFESTLGQQIASAEGCFLLNCAYTLAAINDFTIKKIISQKWLYNHSCIRRIDVSLVHAWHWRRPLNKRIFCPVSPCIKQPNKLNYVVRKCVYEKVKHVHWKARSSIKPNYFGHSFKLFAANDIEIARLKKQKEINRIKIISDKS